jgi:hypothetical protein
MLDSQESSQKVRYRKILLNPTVNPNRGRGAYR